MKENLKKYTLGLILLFVIAIIIGVFMIMYPDISLTTLGVIVALFMIFEGVLLILVDIKMWSYSIPFDGLLQGILRIILGVLLFQNPDSMAVYIGIVLGIWFISSGIGGIKLAYNLRNTEAPWVLMLILGILNILMGGCVLYSPVLSSMAFTTSVGLVLIAFSIFNIIYIFEIRRNLKQVEKAVKEKLKEIEERTVVTEESNEVNEENS